MILDRNRALTLSGVLIAAVTLGALTSFLPLVTAALLATLLGLLGGIWIAARPFWVLLFLTAFMPFESFILKLMPVSDQVYLASQFVSEFLIYLSFAVLALRKLLGRSSFHRTPIDGPLLAFALVALLSTAINQVPLLGSLMNLRSLLRYVVLFYLVINLDLTPTQVNWLIRVILLVGGLQILIGGVQRTSGGAINEILMPRQTNLEMLGQSRQFRLITRGRELGSIFGTLGDSLYLGLFMLVVLAVYLGNLGRLNAWNILFIGIVFVVIMYSYTRAVVFGSLLMLLLFYRLRHGVKKTFLLFLLTAPMVLVAMILTVSSFNETDFVHPNKQQRSIVNNLTGVFSREYFEIAQKQRLGALIGIAPTVLVNKPILGYGPNEKVAIEYLNDSQPSFLLKTLDKRGFEDVYWVAVLTYCGLVGVGALAFLLYRLYSSAYKIYHRAIGHPTRGVALAVACIVGVTPFLLFFYRVLEFRIYSFYFWLLSALMLVPYTQEQKFKKSVDRSIIRIL